MNIRIGNDIKVKFTIRGPQGFDKVNVKQMRVYFINSLFENIETDCNIKKRFPKEPFPQFYTPSKYSIHGCGPWQYNTMPRKCDYATFVPGFNDPHIWPYYNGFGITPDKFSDCCCGMSSGKPKGYDSSSFTFLAPSMLVEDENKAEAYFPAHEQFISGPYKMVVVLVMYESGWGRNNLHTYTIDYGTMFNLVDDETGMVGNIVINGDTGEIDGGKIKQLYFSHSDYYMDANSRLSMGDDDTRAHLYQLYAVMENGSVVEYHYDVWQDNKISFASDNNGLIVSYSGDLSAYNIEDGTQVVITVQDENGPASTQCTIHINNTDTKEYIGFANTTTASSVDLSAKDSQERPLFTQVDDLAGSHSVVNYNSGYYLWLFSKTPIKDVNCNLLDVPLADVQMVGNYYCYHCPNPLIATDFDLTIEK